MKRVVILLVIALLAAGAWFVLGGGLDRVTEERVETALVDAGISPGMAECMAPKMVDRLSIIQLRKLERLGAEEGEGAIPLTRLQAVERLRRVDDPEALEVTARAASSCAFEAILG